MTMDFFLSVPEEISKQLTVDWLNIVDVAKLDSAYMSHKSRERFLRLIADPQSEYVHGTELHFKSTSTDLTYLAWLARRECRVRDVYIPTSFAHDSDLLTKFFQICGTGLRQIQLQQHDSRVKDYPTYGPIIAHVVEHCHHLQELSLRGGFSEDPDLLHQLSLRCPYINTLTFYDCLDYKGDLNKDLSFFALRKFEARHALLSDTLLEAIAIGSANLQELSLSPTWGISPEGLEVVAANCPLIHTVRLTHTMHDHVLVVVMYCKNLQTLEVVCPEDSFTDETLFAIAEHCPALRRLHLTKSLRVTSVGVDEVLKKYTRLRDLNLDYRS